MAYRMTRITDQVRIGQRSDRDFHIEVFERPIDEHEGEVEEIIIPWDAAEELAKYILRNS